MNHQIALSYMVRIEPYTSLFIKYNSRLDHPDRMLSDSLALWKKVFKSMQCNSELIPEWFYLPQIFINNNYCFFGRDSKDKVVNNVTLPKWANDNPFFYCMKFREFIEKQKYCRFVNYWIDMVFGKRQQSSEDLNVFYSFATPEFYKNADEEEITDMALKSAYEFFQLPSQLFLNIHKPYKLKNQDDIDMRNQDNTLNQKNTNSQEDPVLLTEQMTRPEETAVKNVSLLTGIFKNNDENMFFVWKDTRLMSLLIIEKSRKEKSRLALKNKVVLEIDYPYSYVFPKCYITRFNINKKEFMVVGRLFTSKFAIVSLDNDSMKCKYYGIDALTSIITAIHCPRNNKSIITGYQTGSFGIWAINQNENESNVANGLPYTLEFKILHSSAKDDSSEIVAIDSSVDLGMFVAITKNLSVTIHSLENGQCLNWIKLSFDKRLIHGIQLSKNGYFVLATAIYESSEIKSAKKRGEVSRSVTSTLHTFGINGEQISQRAYVCQNKDIKGIMIKERTVEESCNVKPDPDQNHSENILEKIMDDKIFFLDSDNAYIMN